MRKTWIATYNGIKICLGTGHQCSHLTISFSLAVSVKEGSGAVYTAQPLRNGLLMVVRERGINYIACP
jgi:hypothetical protein